MHSGVREALFKQRHIPRCRIPRAVWFVLVALSALTAFGAALLGWAGSGLPPPRFTLAPGGDQLEPIDDPLWRRASDWIAHRKYITLTFDDGPYGHGVDERILAILAKHDAHAIFFEVCAHITKITEDVPTQIVAAGDLVANHSFDHPFLTRLPIADLTHEIGGCSLRIAALTGLRPAFFRPPFGQTSPGVLQAVHAAGMTQVLWNTSSGDTWRKSPQAIVGQVLQLASNKSILLMHSRPLTVSALDQLLTQLQKHGFRFVVPKTGDQKLGHVKSAMRAQTSPAS